MDNEVLSYQAWISRQRYLNYINKRKTVSGIIGIPRKIQKDSSEHLTKILRDLEFQYIKMIRKSRLQQKNAEVGFKEIIDQRYHQAALSDQQN